ncbi:hypothetical protein FHR34_007589 [Kitasatospora kifunensis]|uniref:Uncharacterized protein n=1 Tax=Kitasatospora kifunensis TaxID=58351 RepID=A0A7W7RAN5_KITKI|nr:hypothetical protein [Kitasatospora kifunensis]
MIPGPRRLKGGALLLGVEEWACSARSDLESWSIE